jgi:hypothetical protein
LYMKEMRSPPRKKAAENINQKPPEESTREYWDGDSDLRLVGLSRARASVTIAGRTPALHRTHSGLISATRSR